MKTDRKGFSLIELLITVAVLGVLLTIGIPSFQTMREDYKLTTQTNELIGNIQLARSEAIKRGSDITLTIDEGWVSVSEGDEDLGREPLNADLGIDPSRVFTNGIVFAGNGLAYDSDGVLATGSITVCSAKLSRGNARVINMGSGGQTSVSHQDVADCTGG